MKAGRMNAKTLTVEEAQRIYWVAVGRPPSDPGSDERAWWEIMRGLIERVINAESFEIALCHVVVVDSSDYQVAIEFTKRIREAAGLVDEQPEQDDEPIGPITIQTINDVKVER